MWTCSSAKKRPQCSDRHVDVVNRRERDQGVRQHVPSGWPTARSALCTIAAELSPRCSDMVRYLSAGLS